MLTDRVDAVDDQLQELKEEQVKFGLLQEIEEQHQRIMDANRKIVSMVLQEARAFTDICTEVQDASMSPENVEQVLPENIEYNGVLYPEAKRSRSIEALPASPNKVPRFAVLTSPAAVQAMHVVGTGSAMQLQLQVHERNDHEERQ